MTSPGESADREVYFEFNAMGASVRVAAIDAATGVETSWSVRPAPPPPISNASRSPS
jgi:hypothetical protein